MVRIPYPSAITRFANRHQEIALLILRIGLSSVTLYFGITGMLDYTSTLAWIAPSISTFIASVIPLKIFVLVLTLSQVIAGLAILTGLFTRLLGLGAFFMMLAIVANLFMATGTVGDIVMRDIALASADLILFFFGPGKYSLDRLLELD
jgi:uncharacterized membrane protein YphA (DoxX/SURF4 family)